jgi:NAD+ synthase
MKLDSEVFKIKAAAYVDRLCEFIRENKSELNRDRILVPLSGGVDSSTVVALCARAVGSAQVTALLMPERQGNPEAARYGRMVVQQFGVGSLERDISGVLSRLGTYSYIIPRIPLRGIQEWISRRYLKSAKRNPFLQLAKGEASALERKGFARYNSKHRVRLVTEYLVAEEGNYLVAGCAHKSEDLVGLYVKFGVDDNADIMPLKNLYRSHIVQLAEFLGVPGAVIRRPPNPDIIPGVNDKYVDLLDLPSSTLDLILYGIEHGMDDEDITGQLDLAAAKVAEIRDLVRRTEHMRTPSRSLTWE